MRNSMSSLLGVMLIGCCCCSAAAVETGSRWWPFGRKDQAEDVSQPSGVANGSGMSSPAIAAQQQTLPQYPTTAEPERRWMIESPLAKVSWPRVHLPEVPKPHVPEVPLWPSKSQVDAARNSWVEKSPNPKEPSPLQAVTDGARRVGQSTRSAWDKTVDVFMQNDSSASDSSRVARRENRPPFWKRMFGADEQPPPGPQTVTEWMAQERLDP